MTLLRSMPVLQVRDVAASAAFYEELGFVHSGLAGDPPVFCIMQRGDVTLALDRARDGAVALNQWWAAYVYVEDVDALHQEWSAHAVEITAPEDRPYGCRDFDLVDLDGHRIAFGTDIDDTARPGLRK